MRSTVGLELAIRLLFRGLPAAARRRLAGAPIVVDGEPLDPDLQLLLRLERMTTAGTPATPVPRRRAHLDAATALVGGRPPSAVTSRAVVLDRNDAGPPLAARLFTANGLAPGSPLLVYLHGGGWVTGGLNSHDTVCRFLAVRGRLRILAVDYRLAPEHPFPAAVLDASAALRFARTRAAALGADPGKVALGGDSAGANLAVVTAHLAARAGEPGPDRLLLFYPPCDATRRTASRDLFADGFLLTDGDIVWFRDHYIRSEAQWADPRASILLAEDLSGLPPTHLITAGFDPIRDEGEAFGRRLAESGVQVVMRREPDLVHGFVNMIGLSARCRAAVADAAAALRRSLDDRNRPDRPDQLEWPDQPDQPGPAAEQRVRDAVDPARLSG